MRTSLSARPVADRIVGAAIRVWGADPSASLDVVAREAGVGRATLHRHFASRADLLRAATLDGVAVLLRALDDAGLEAHDPARALDAALDALVGVGDRLHFVLVAAELAEDAELAEAEAIVDARLLPVIERALAAGVLRAELPSAWLFRAMEALVYAAWTAVARGEVARLDAPALLRSTVLRGLGGRPPRAAAGARSAAKSSTRSNRTRRV
jgi:AcrR family transcriptional regulator